MALIEFKNLPDTSTPLNAENLNYNFEYLEEKIENRKTIYTGNLQGGQTVKLNNVKRFIDVYVSLFERQLIKYTIDTQLPDTKVYGSGIGIAHDSTNGQDYYISESTFDSNGDFKHERIGYINISTGTYTARNNRTEYYIYKIETYD